ncbi:MAG: hypothetical protein A2284_13185 [Deltaproteobacteria bacterium RIFOXYA12_FULL_61_11]|nr:MAG: hypothetical protein A2284_13185 [Deltaproteobacteria bacterium RIFOXYA12_FULL_61_11]
MVIIGQGKAVEVFLVGCQPLIIKGLTARRGLFNKVELTRVGNGGAFYSEPHPFGGKATPTPIQGYPGAIVERGVDSCEFGDEGGLSFLNN